MLATVPKTVEPTIRPMRVTHALALLAGAAGAMIPACANPEALAPITAQHVMTLEALQMHTEASRVLLERQVDAAIEIQRIALTGRLHRELLRLGMMTPDFTAMPGRLEELLSDAEARAALLDEIRHGRMTLAEAQAWLIDYALTCKMSRGTEARRVLLNRLALVEQFEEGAKALYGAIAAHGETIAGLIGELRADTQAIEVYVNRGELPTTWDRAKTRELVEQYVLTRIKSTERRAAAAELLELLLTPWPSAMLTEGGAS